MFLILEAVERHSPFLIFMLAFTMNRYASRDTFLWWFPQAQEDLKGEDQEVAADQVPL